MTTLDVQVPNLNTRRELLTRRLGEFRRKARKHLLLSGGARLFAEVVVGLTVSLLLDHWLRLSLPMRVVFLAAMVVGFVYELWQLVVLPMRIPRNLVGMAAAIDRVRGARNGDSLAPRVATVLELPELLKREAAPSAAMVERAVIAADDSLRGVDFDAQLDEWRWKLNWFLIGAIVLVTLMLVVMYPGNVGLWGRRWFAFSNEPWPQDTYLSVMGLEDGKIIVPRGEPFTLRVAARKDSVVPEGVSLRLREGKGSRTTAAMNLFAANDFRYDLPAVEVPTTVEAEGGDDDTGEFLIEPVDRPRITSLELVSQHPTEAQPTKHDFSGEDADLSFLPKTKLQLTFAANVAIAEAHVSGAPAEVERVGADTFRISWEQNKAVAMQIELLSEKAHLLSLPTPVTIGLKVDQPPRVSLSFSGVRQRITPMATIPLTILARDDYGVAKMELGSKAEFLDGDKKQQVVTKSQGLYGVTTQATSQAMTQPSEGDVASAKPQAAALEQEVERRVSFNVGDLKIAPGTILSLSGSATDQCYLGAQTGVSRAATFSVVNPQELFREILLRQQGERAKFRKQIDECGKIKDSLTTITSADAAVEVARQHRAVQREVERITTSLAESMLEMRLNQLGTQEAYDLMENKVIAPLKGMDTDLMTPQRDALDGLGKTTKVEDAIGREDQIIAKMQEILKQMSQWDSFVDVLNQLNEIIRMQESVKVGTEGLKSKQVEGVFEK